MSVKNVKTFYRYTVISKYTQAVHRHFLKNNKSDLCIRILGLLEMLWKCVDPLNWMKSKSSVEFQMQILSPNARNSSMWWWIMIITITLDHLNRTKSLQILKL